jgi:RND family efflux transporter MFP subunit
MTSERTAEVATRMSGTVESVEVDVGARVRRGDPLVSLDATDIQARMSAARAQEELAQRSFKRIENLHADGAASLQELDQARAALAGAEAQRAEAQAQESYAVVRAPFDGVVTRRDVDPGDLAVPGRPLFTMVASGALKVVADLPAQRAGALSAGDPVRVRLNGEVREARVTRVVPALGSGSRTFRVEGLLDGGSTDVLPGTYARLEVVRGGEGPRWIPSDAVVTRGQLTGVFSVEADTLRLRWVRLGQRRDGAVELLAGPAGALTVVRSPAAELTDGVPVASAHEQPWMAPGIAASTVAGGGEVDR